MTGKKQLVLAVILVLVTLVLVATTSVPSASASASPVNVVVVNKTTNFVVEVDTSQGCYNWAGNQMDVPAGKTFQAHGNTNQTFNITLFDPRPGAGEIFVACLATHTPNTVGDSTLTVVEDASGQVAVYYTRTDGWMSPLWAPRFDPQFASLVVKYAPASPKMTPADFTVLFKALPQATFDAKIRSSAVLTKTVFKYTK